MKPPIKEEISKKKEGKKIEGRLKWDLVRSRNEFEGLKVVTRRKDKRKIGTSKRETNHPHKESVRF